MASAIWLVACAALVLLVTWATFSGVARVVGGLVIFDSLGGIVFGFGHVPGPRLIWLAIGLGLWLAGHWLHALKYQMWRTHLARATWNLPLLRTLAPRLPATGPNW